MKHRHIRVMHCRHTKPLDTRSRLCVASTKSLAPHGQVPILDKWKIITHPDPTHRGDIVPVQFNHSRTLTLKVKIFNAVSGYGSYSSILYTRVRSESGE